MKLIACETIKDEIEAIAKGRMKTEYIDYALHRWPERLQERLQESINSSVDMTILLGYGLCSQGLIGLKSERQRFIITRVDHCLSLLFGCHRRYREEIQRSPGTVFLSRGWIKYGIDPYSKYQRYCNQYGEHVARMVIEEEYRNHDRLLMIRTIDTDKYDDTYRQHAKKIAGFLNLRYEETEGSNHLLKRLIHQVWGRGFVRVEPGQEIKKEDFLTYEQEEKEVIGKCKLLES